ncbi:bifunctional [glutamine synthetase] adenylyltransferase/[glutamine synthetase]-adenylyl-L-tyrosine phosphorylase [Aureimonas ureilytica]|uniref:bifunctional [glutamine synthetase] adenylyltransferase/[glutamine synthetase]-adenylyl-L-tyrosine phosphorylase n=1 Tax=Aureimonas ureilytica TaxID=401562 RepID=UPI00058D1F4B|nr:bifunctional [glutamine synthetase] adenylyltransferase/[glutamine synthetase]-adenylyl-L-tyrosine phosphorylase [Aureimonas ureilytica]
MTLEGRDALRIGGALPLVPLSPEKARSCLADLAAAATAQDLDRLAAWAALDGPEQQRLGAALSLSPHLEGLALRAPQWLDRLFEEEAGARVEALIAALGAPVPEGASEASLMTELRLSKNEASLLIALRDLFGAAPPDVTTRHLSGVAEGAVKRALRFALLDLHRRGQLRLPDLAHPERGSGLFVLGMGKLGGEELNYSSDIDLVVLFEPEAEAVLDPPESVEMYSRLARRLVKMIGERSRDGYVFRTDLRLRPDPSAMPLAVPVPTALVYYESSGRDWERAAMIKARPIAGDEEASTAFLRDITPFVWRRYLDFVAIGDIHAMKMRIDRHRGFESIMVAGQNVKLGRGGIREIEFFAQAQQLIAGGRNPALRLRRTDDALAQLAREGWIEPAAAEEMTQAYWFLRRVEHAVQMVADEQTHTLPETEGDLLRVARLCNFETLAEFSAALIARLETVEARFSALFAEHAPVRSDEGAIALLSDAEDPGALAWLERVGYRRTGDIGRIVHGWAGGRYRATRSEAARDQLVRVLPSLLEAFARGRDPDAALAGFDRFLFGLPSGLQFFSLIASNPRLLELLALAISSAPRLADTISLRPHVFDALLDPAFYREIPTRALLRERLALFLRDAQFFEERLARLRIFASEQRFLVGIRLLAGAIEGEAAGGAFTALADAVLEALVEGVEAEFRRAHGRVPGGRLVVLGLGRLGSGEMTASSDVDLMLLYDHDPEAETSDGDRPLPVSTYYTRLTQRLIAALTAPMADGVLYEVDFRLRPSGNKGPLATHIDAFRKYQREAWTWERMALTRSRSLAGDAALTHEIGEAIRAAIESHASDPLLGYDIADMRARLEVQKPARGALDLKRLVGGLTDLEFIAQWAILSGAVPLSFIGRSTERVLAELARRHPDLPGVEALPAAMTDLTRVVHLHRLGPGTAFRVADLPPGLADRLARSLDLADQAGIEPHILDLAERVRASFAALLPFEGAGDERLPRG